LNRGAVVVMPEGDGDPPLHGNHIVAENLGPLQPDANDRSEQCPTPETAWRTVAQWLLDAILGAGAAGATFYGGIWWEPDHVSETELAAERLENSKNPCDRAVSILARGLADRARTGRARR